ncbi:hypothetical protein ACMFMG_002292 [Clarireedia jacksonii]
MSDPKLRSVRDKNGNKTLETKRGNTIVPGPSGVLDGFNSETVKALAENKRQKERTKKEALIEKGRRQVRRQQDRWDEEQEDAKNIPHHPRRDDSGSDGETTLAGSDTETLRSSKSKSKAKADSVRGDGRELVKVDREIERRERDPRRPSGDRALHYIPEESDGTVTSTDEKVKVPLRLKDRPEYDGYSSDGSTTTAPDRRERGKKREDSSRGKRSTKDGNESVKSGVSKSSRHSHNSHQSSHRRAGSLTASSLGALDKDSTPLRDQQSSRSNSYVGDDQRYESDSTTTATNAPPRSVRTKTSRHSTRSDAPSVSESVQSRSSRHSTRSDAPSASESVQSRSSRHSTRSDAPSASEPVQSRTSRHSRRSDVPSRSVKDEDSGSDTETERGYTISSSVASESLASVSRHRGKARRPAASVSNASTSNASTSNASTSYASTSNASRSIASTSTLSGEELEEKVRKAKARLARLIKENRSERTISDAEDDLAEAKDALKEYNASRN